MSEIKVNKISPKQLCTQLTLGDSGDTIIIPTGATIQNCGTATGFGRTGTVNWDTTVKTTGFTAVNGTGYFCNTTSGAFTVTLPATPTAGNIVAFKDYALTWNTNNLTIGRNSSNIEGQAVNSVQNTQGQSITLIYVDSTKGWVIIDNAQYSNLNQAAYVTATGGTVITCGNYKTHIFTTSGCFVVSNAGNAQGSNSVEYMVVAGGGGGSQSRAGGGGAGGYRQNYPSPTTAGLPVTATTYPITIGSGGAGASPLNGTPGSNSVFSTITSAGGGASNYYAVGSSGGSGGGGGLRCAYAGGAGNTPPVSPPQGNPGGPAIPGNTPGWGGGGGGGGAGATGGTATPSIAGAGGVGSPMSPAFIGPTAPSYGTTGPAPGRYFAGGGGGGAANAGFSPTTVGAGGSGGGGSGGQGTGTISVAGTVNTGGGGGGGGDEPQSVNGSAGGSGIVMIRYKYQ